MKWEKAENLEEGQPSSSLGKSGQSSPPTRADFTARQVSRSHTTRILEAAIVFGAIVLGGILGILALILANSY